MFSKDDKRGILLTGEFHELVKKIAKMAEKTGGWRNFCTDDPTEDLQTMFIGSRLRDTTLGALDDDSVTVTDRELKWGDMKRSTATICLRSITGPWWMVLFTAILWSGSW